MLPAELRGPLGIIEASGLIKQRNGKDWKGEMTEKAGMPGLGACSLSPLVCAPWARPPCGSCNKTMVYSWAFHS